jgi:hypothetical protein
MGAERERAWRNREHCLTCVSIASARTRTCSATRATSVHCVSLNFIWCQWEEWTKSVVFLAAKLQVTLMEKTMALLRLLQLHFPIGFKGDELEKMCALINLFLSKQLLQLTLPKCQVTRGVDFIGTWYNFFTYSHTILECATPIFSYQIPA